MGAQSSESDSMPTGSSAWVDYRPWVRAGLYAGLFTISLLSAFALRYDFRLTDTDGAPWLGRQFLRSLPLALAIKLHDGGPVLHRGVRVGWNGKLFRMCKFRTMAPDAEKRGPSTTSEDDPRITSVGRFLRRYKIDELPQLLNVLTGEMSVVGPRPQVPFRSRRSGLPPGEPGSSRPSSPRALR